MNRENTTLFDRIGGMQALDEATTLFFVKVVSDLKINYYFKSVDMERQVTMFRSFLAHAFGAPFNYEGEDLKEAHEHMQITTEIFEKVVGYLEETLFELNKPLELIEEVVAIVRKLKKDITND